MSEKSAGGIGVTFGEEYEGVVGLPPLFGVRVPYSHFSGAWMAEKITVTVPQHSLGIHYNMI